MLGTLYSDSEGDQAQPLVTGIQGEVNTQNMKIHAHLCAKIPLKSKKKKKNTLVFKEKIYFRTQDFGAAKSSLEVPSNLIVLQKHP